MYKEILKYQRIYLSSHVIYGSSRLGTKDYLPGQIYSVVDYTQAQPVTDTVNLLGRRPWYSNEYQDDIIYTHTEPWQATQTGMFSAGERIGEKQYELTNHLGNVMATVSDNKVGIYNGNGNLELAGWHPALRAAYDYYPFGMLMPDRYISDTTQHCVTVSQPHWAWKWVLIGCVDQYKWVWPKLQLFGAAQAIVGDNGVLLTAPNPGDGMSFELSVTPNVENEIHFEINRLDMAKNASIQILETNGSEQTVLTAVPVKDAEGLVIRFKPHSGKVKFVLWGSIKVWVRRICAGHMDWVEEDQLVTICDGDKDKYRFGFNGQEKVNEWSGIGNYLDFGARGLDTRVGRWFTPDPKEAGYPNISTYAFSFNNPIYFIDLDGERGIASIAGASGTKKDPIVVTVTANYYYQSATDAQKKAMGNVQSDLKRPKSFKDANGKYYSVIINVSFSQSDNPSESAAKDVGQNGFGYGNVFNIDAGMGNNSGESGHASNTKIAIFDGGVKAKAQNWTEGDNAKKSYQTIFRNILIEEVLHNLGGLHQDGGAVPSMTDYKYGRRSMTDSEKPAYENTYTSGNAEAIFMRIDQPLGTDAKENPKDKKGREIDPPLRDESGTAGEVRTDKLPEQ